MYCRGSVCWCCFYNIQFHRVALEQNNNHMVFEVGVPNFKGKHACIVLKFVVFPCICMIRALQLYLVIYHLLRDLIVFFLVLISTVEF